MMTPPKMEVQLGYAALVLIVIIFVILMIAGGMEFDIEDTPDVDTSTYNGSSKTLKELNDFGVVYCDQCIQQCQWTLAKSKAECQEKCVSGVNCQELDLS